MKSKSTLRPKGIALKLIRFAVIFVLVMGVLFMALFAAHLRGLREMLIKQEKEQQEIVSEKSQTSLTDITEENLHSLIASATERMNDEFRVARQDMLALGSQVEEVFRHPENFQPKKISAPRMENGDKPVMQLLAPDGYENISPETYEMMQRLANLEPIMREIVLSEDYIIDSYISTLDGVTLSFDRLSEAKFDENGNVKKYDARERGWFQGALESKDVYFSSTLKSSLYGFKEIVYSLPVYVDDVPVAVIEGCMHIEDMSRFIHRSGKELGTSGFSILVSKEGFLASSPRETGELKLVDDVNSDIRDSVNPELKVVIGKGLSGETGIGRAPVDGEEYYAAYGYIPESGWTQIVFASVPEVTEPSDQLIGVIAKQSNEIITRETRAFQISVVIMFVVFLAIVTVSNITVSRRAKKRVEPIVHMTERLKEFSGVNMFFEMEDIYRTGDEVEVLAESFETMSEKMRNYVDEIIDEMTEKAHVKTELALAGKIQTDLLPNTFPAFPDRPEINVYASMTPAKEVGGDFYDFFFIDEDHLALVIADVSGKGIPAAMFMMMAKCTLRTCTMPGLSPAEVLMKVNNLIWENNKETMFVTVWLGILDVRTGVLTAANAGHEYPILKDAEGEFKVMKDKHGCFLGGKKNMKYTSYEIRMKPGSKLFIYTDGVPEARDENGEFFGMERTVSAVNGAADATADEILNHVECEVRKFVKDAEQFDDLTMLCVEYFG